MWLDLIDVSLQVKHCITCWIWEFTFRDIEHLSRVTQQCIISTTGYKHFSALIDHDYPELGYNRQVARVIYGLSDSGQIY